MNNDLELDLKAIDELLAAESQELSGLDASRPKANLAQDQSVTEQLAAPQTQHTKTTPLLFFKFLRQHLTKKIALGVFFLFICVIALGGLLGYQIAGHTIAARTPLEKITQQGITFEEKNFVTYAGFGDKAIVTAFIDTGMSVNTVRSTDGWTPLMSASFYKRLETVQLLLEKQAAVNLQDRYGKTALMQAAVMGAEDIVILLLEYGADPNIKDNNGRTALEEAYYKKHAGIAEILKNAGANPVAQTPAIVKTSSHPQKALEKEAPAVSSPANEETRLSVGRAGFVQIGMSLQDLRKKYPSLTVSEKYVDGTLKSIASIYLSEQNAPSLQLELSSGKLKLISTISIYDKTFSTDKQITIHSTVGDIRSQYTINDVKVIDNSLFLVVRSMKMLFELDINKNFLPTEWLNTGNPNSIHGETKIKRIVMY